MHHEDYTRIWIMENVCYKPEPRIEDEGTGEIIRIKPGIHTQVHRK
ncbi:hypothetical protein [Fusibacter sp. 3D3]|nr:hypothetical protein [Fusibacter sp. 3D3]GAU75803.1 hypothetical protein F3D3_0399 [Fusibacter sp. 3D3]